MQVNYETDQISVTVKELTDWIETRTNIDPGKEHVGSFVLVEPDPKVQPLVDRANELVKQLQKLCNELYELID